MQFKDKTVIVTGAGSGIGRATALLFAKEGANLLVSDINKKTGAETVEMILADRPKGKKAGQKPLFCHCDISDHVDVENMVQKTKAHFGSLDIAVNNAGIGAKSLLKTHEHTLEDWDKVIAVNQSGVFYCMKYQLKEMTEKGGGCIVNISSIAGLRGLSNNLAYSASKHAVIGMTKTAAQEYARHNIRVNAVCPVFTHSPLFQQLLESKQGMEEKLKRGIPMGRFGQPLEIAEAILWLASDQSKFITGIALPVDGGLMA